MLFNSFAFLFSFLPLILAAFFAARQFSPAVAHLALILGSLCFYALLDWVHLPVLLGSGAINYLLGQILSGRIAAGRSTLAWLWLAVLFNLGLLGGYKYLGLVLPLLGIDFPAIAAPLGISFFTFHQLSYLIDIHRRRIAPTGLRDYSLYVSFFPHLIAGPIMRYGQFAPQLAGPGGTVDLLGGLFFFAVGLFKKTVLADTLAPIADRVFAAAAAGQLLGSGEALKGILAYTWQIYFDFSGYADMAIGLGLLLGIALPINFAAPYRAASISEFWRRWHITLSQFLRDYVYIPLGGSRHGGRRQVVALLLTMTLAGLWHGAALTFVAWGALHGLALVVAALWRRSGGRLFVLPQVVSVGLTFVVVALLWVLFRAEDFSAALACYRGLFTSSAPVWPAAWTDWLLDPAWREWLWLGAGAGVVFVLKPTALWAGYQGAAIPAGRLGLGHGVAAGILLWLSLKTMTLEPLRSFVYFVF